MGPKPEDSDGSAGAKDEGEGEATKEDEEKDKSKSKKKQRKSGSSAAKAKPAEKKEDDDENKNNTGGESEPATEESDHEENDGSDKRSLPTSPEAWSVASFYERNVVKIDEYFKSLRRTLGYSETGLSMLPNQEIVRATKSVTVRRSNQEVERAQVMSVHGVAQCNAGNCRMNVEPHPATFGSKVALGLGVESVTSSMIKDVSSRYRAGSFPPPGQLITPVSNAETDNLSKQVLSQLSAGSALMNYTHVALRVFINYFNIEWARDRQANMGDVGYGVGGAYAGNPNGTLGSDQQELSYMLEFSATASAGTSLLLRIPRDNYHQTAAVIGLLLSSAPSYEIGALAAGQNQPFVADYRLGQMDFTVIVRNLSTSPQVYTSWITQNPVMSLPDVTAVRRAMGIIFGQIPDPEAVRAGVFMAMNIVCRIPTDGQAADFDANHVPVMPGGGILDTCAPQSSTITMIGNAFYDTRLSCNQCAKVADSMLSLMTDRGIIALMALDVTAMVVTSRSLTLRAFGAGFNILAPNAAINDVYNVLPPVDVRWRCTDIVALDENAISDYGAAVVKGISDVFGLNLPRSVQVMLSRLGTWNQGMRVMRYVRCSWEHWVTAIYY
ncbi:unnamed protein product [Symbiodinium microadriaticum]|nr:unnamed protein product [Symbiodinium microadriaticum]